MRFHLLDRIETICHGKFITAVKCISLSDDVFNEHFPGYPHFPGSLILEGLAQLGGSFFEITMKERRLPVKRALSRRENAEGHSIEQFLQDLDGIKVAHAVITEPGT